MIARPKAPVFPVLRLHFLVGRLWRLWGRQCRLVPATPRLEPMIALNLSDAPVTCLDDLGDAWRPFAASLDARTRVRHMDDDLIRILLQHRSQARHVAVRIAILVGSVCGEDYPLAAQDQTAPRARVLRVCGRSPR